MFKNIQIKEIMNSKVHTVAPDVTAWQASNKLKALQIGCLIVVEDNAICGIVSERDIIYKVVTTKKDASLTKVREIMSSPVLTIKPNASANDALFIASTRHVRHLPVVDDDGKLVGLLGIRDLIYHAINCILSEENYLAITNSTTSAVGDENFHSINSKQRKK